MEHNIMWSPWSESGLEHVRLLLKDQEIVADSVIIGVHNHIPFSLQYNIVCDSNWRVRELFLKLLSDNGKSINIQSDGQGHWTTITGIPISSLEGCIDIDISATPLTNTLPIRRLGINPGQSAELLVAYVSIPEMELTSDRQRYTCLESHAHGALYRYESLESDFSAVLPVDSDGLVIDYPGLFKRVWPPADISLYSDTQ